MIHITHWSIVNDYLKDETIIFSIYPNPVIDELRISGLQTGEVISVYDLSGRVLLEQKTTGAVERMKTTQLNAGVYFIRVGNSTKRFSKL